MKWCIFLLHYWKMCYFELRINDYRISYRFQPSRLLSWTSFWMMLMGSQSRTLDSDLVRGGFRPPPPGSSPHFWDHFISKYFQPLASRNFPINVCLFVAETLVYKYTILCGRVLNGCSHNFKFTETCSNFCTILYLSQVDGDMSWLIMICHDLSW